MCKLIIFFKTFKLIPAVVDRDLVERVKSAVDIVDVAQGYFPLTQKGERFVALCPFHREKTPSFSIQPSRQIFHCFGCGKGGDVLTLVMELDRLTFPEALRQLAARAGIAMKDDRGAGRAAGSRLRQLEIARAAAQYYSAALEAAAGGAARRYLEGRGLDRSVQERFAIGYAPDGWRHLHDHLLGLGFELEELLRSGLVRQNEQGRTWDLLRHRVVIPIRDDRGRVIAFGGRVLDDSEPKYLNSPENDLFAKRSVLFNMDQAQKAAATAGFFVVVEGYMDVIAACRRGIGNVVGSLGTSFTREHVGKLARFARKVVLLFDADAGGRRASERGAPLLLQEGLDVGVVSLPAGLDPDDFLRDRDAAEFDVYLREHEEDLVSFLVRSVRERLIDPEAPAGRAQAAREVLQMVDQTRDPILRDLLLRRISQEFGVDEGVLRREASPVRGPVEAGAEAAFSPGARAQARLLRGWEKDEATVIQAATTGKGLAERATKELSETDFRDPGRRKVFSAVKRLLEQGQSPAPSVVLEYLAGDPGAREALTEALGRGGLPGESPESAVDRMVARRHEVKYRRNREEASRSGLLMSEDRDDELNRKLADFSRFHAGRLAKGLPKDQAATDAGGEAD